MQFIAVKRSHRVLTNQSDVRPTTYCLLALKAEVVYSDLS